MKVSAQVRERKDKDGKTLPGKNISVEYNVPGDLEGLRKSFGDEVVNAAAKGAIVISLQAYLRRLLDKGKSNAEIQAEAIKWKPDTRTVVKQSAFEKAAGALDKLSPEERAKLLAALQAKK